MSTIFTKVYNLSDNVKYMNFKVDTTPAGGGNPTGTTSLQDRKDLMHNFLEMITTDRDETASGAINKSLGWQRIDGADSAGAVLSDSGEGRSIGTYPNGSGGAVYGFIRSKCYDHSTSDHYKYVRFKMYERNEMDLFDGTGNGRGPRYLSSENVLVLRYDIYSDWPGLNAADSAAYVDSIEGGTNYADADGYGSTYLDAGIKAGKEYASKTGRNDAGHAGHNNNVFDTPFAASNYRSGFRAAYNSSSLMVNALNNIPHNSSTGNFNYVDHMLYGSHSVVNVNYSNNWGNSLAYPWKESIEQQTETDVSLSNSNNNYTAANIYSGMFPTGTDNSGAGGSSPEGMNTKRYGAHYLYNFFPFYFGVNGMGDSDLSIKNSYGELKLIIDGNGTLWGFGDQDNVGAGGLDSNNGTGTHKGVNASGAEARYLSTFVTQHQDDNPEKRNAYNTILFMGEYKKEFGEPVNTGYLHNGIKFNAHNFIMNNGVATPPNFKAQMHFQSNSSWNSSVHTTQADTNSSWNRNYAGADINHWNTAINNNLGPNIDNVTFQYDGQTANIDAMDPNLQNNDTYNFRSNSTRLAYSSGHSMMGKMNSWNAGNEGGAAENRSWSMGFTNDDANAAGKDIRDYDITSWRSRNMGNIGVHSPNAATNNFIGTETYAGITNNNTTSFHSSWVGFDGAQFALTEYPTRSNQTHYDSAGASSYMPDNFYASNAGTLGGRYLSAEFKESVQRYNDYVTPSSGREHLSATRLHMGYLGYVGHINSSTAYSLNELFFGSQHGLFGDEGSEHYGALSVYDIGQPSGNDKLGTIGPSIPLVASYFDSADGNIQGDIQLTRHYVEEFHPTPMQQNQYSVFEPVLSVGLLRAGSMGLSTSTEVRYDNNASSNNYSPIYHSNMNDVLNLGHSNLGTSNNVGNTAWVRNYAFGEYGTPGGSNKARSAFAMLGRTYGLKLFGPYNHDKYNFLDAVAIQLDDDGFYAVNPNNVVDHWVVPANNDQCSFLFKK